MGANRKIKLYHSTHTRSTGVLILLEERSADYELEVLSLKSGDQLKPEYLAVNPMGKVPAIVHDGAFVAYVERVSPRPGRGVAGSAGLMDEWIPENQIDRSFAWSHWTN